MNPKTQTKVVTCKKQNKNKQVTWQLTPIYVTIYQYSVSNSAQQEITDAGDDYRL